VVGGAKKPAKKKHKGPKPIPPARLRVVTVNGIVRACAFAGGRPSAG